MTIRYYRRGLRPRTAERLARRGWRRMRRGVELKIEAQPHERAVGWKEKQ